MNLRFLSQRLFIIPCLLSVFLFSQQALSANQTYRTKEHILELALKEGLVDMVLTDSYVAEVLALKKVPEKGESFDLSNFDLEKINWRDVINLLHTRERITDFSNLDLSGLNLSWLELMDPSVNFDNSNFKGTILDQARIRGSMKNVLMDETTSLRTTDLQAVNVRGADLRTNLDEVNLWMVKFDNKTKFPENFITRSNMRKRISNSNGGWVEVDAGTQLAPSSCGNFFSRLF